ncbi:MAG TPA: hypothetical protein VF490_06490 [Chryseosolibacter sp.]
MVAIKTMVDLFTWHKNAEKNKDQTIGDLFRKNPFDPLRMTSGAAHRAFVMYGNVPVGKKLNRAGPVSREKMQPDPERIETLARIEARHIFFRKKTGYIIGIELRLCDIRVNRAVKLFKNNDIVGFFFHARLSATFPSGNESINLLRREGRPSSSF